MKRSIVLVALSAFFASSLFGAPPPVVAKEPITPYRTLYFPVNPGGDRQVTKEIAEMFGSNPSAELVSMIALSQGGTTSGVLVVVKLPSGANFMKKLSKEEFDKMIGGEKSGKAP